MRERENSWQRIEAVINWANMSTNYFARYIGLARGENLYQIKRGNNGISFDVAERIITKFPQVNKLWLLTGEGEMFHNEKLRGAQIPFYDVDVEQSIAHLADLKSNTDLIMPPTCECDLAMTYMGRAMGTLIPTGTIVFLKAVERDAIIPGEEYLIVSRKMVTLRIVRQAAEANKLRLVAGDKDNYDDIILNTNDIVSIYRVKAKLVVNS